MEALDKFVEYQLECLDLEREEEIRQSDELLCKSNFEKILEALGHGFLKCLITSSRTGLFGRLILCLSKKNGAFPASRLSAGDIVGLYVGSLKVFTGVLLSLSEHSLSISLDENNKHDNKHNMDWNLESSDLYTIAKLANQTTYKRLKKSLMNLKTSREDHHLKDILFGKKNFSNSDSNQHQKINFIQKNLDESQKEAVEFALSQKEVAIIHGPPGTGKTTTLVEIILQSVKKGQKILVSAPSNIAVDNLLEKLIVHKISVVRIGHPGRMTTTLQNYSLDAFILSSEQSSLVKDIRREIHDLIVGKKSFLDKTQRKKQLVDLRKECREREDKAIRGILSGVSVILATLTSGSQDSGPLAKLPKNHFDLCIIDECSQALEMACWNIILQSPKLVLSGDHHQLPPTVKSIEALKRGLGISFMERLIEKDSSIVKQLLTQYRMHADISSWSSTTFYDSSLKDSPSVSSHLLKDYPNVREDENTSLPLLFIDTAYCNMREMDDDGGISKGNFDEVSIVSHHVTKLLQAGVQPSTIAVIAPYNLQVEWIRHKLSAYSEIEVHSVDGFQGREKDVIILSCVRSNSQKEIGFLADVRRLNVAVTRARRHLTIIGDSITLSSNRIFRKLFRYLEKRGEVRSAAMADYVLAIQKDSHEFSNFKFSERIINTVATKTTKKKNQKKENKDPKVLETKEEKNFENTKTHFFKIIHDFVQNTNCISYEFDSSLSSHERLFIHEISQDLNLSHYSIGEGDARRIVIAKKSSVHEKPKLNSEAKINKEDLVEEHVQKLQTSSNPLYGPQITSQIDSQVIKTLDEKHLGNKMVSTRDKNKEPLNSKLQGSISSKENSNNSDFENVLSSLRKATLICNREGCKVKISTLGFNCAHCSHRFCLSHFSPEIHGCGKEAKKSAMIEFKKSGRVELDVKKRQELQKKLEKKISQKTESRKVQKNKKKSS